MEPTRAELEKNFARFVAQEIERRIEAEESNAV